MKTGKTTITHHTSGPPTVVVGDLDRAVTVEFGNLTFNLKTRWDGEAVFVTCVGKMIGVGTRIILPFSSNEAMEYLDPGQRQEEMEAMAQSD